MSTRVQAAAAERIGVTSTSGVTYEAPYVAYASTALRKGAQLLKYCRRGKPHACHVQLSPDECEIHWVSGAGKLRTVRLAAVRDVLAGQSTAVFRKQQGLHRESTSFSLVYRADDGGERTLDLVCKDEEQLQLWYHGLRAALFKFSADSPVAGAGPQLQAAVRSAGLVQRWKLGGSQRPSTPRRVQPLGGGQASGRLSGALGLPPPPPPLPGEVFVWGGAAERTALHPSPLPRSEGLDVALVSLGLHHGALLSRDGQVFTWGQSDHGRLGHGSQHHVASPTRLDALSDVRVTQIVCSDKQTAAVAEDGQLFVWGETSLFGVLGHSASRTQWVPRPVHSPLQGVLVRQVASGPSHSALVAADGALFTWGDGVFGALGHDDCEAQLLPRRVEAFAGYTVTQITRLFTWGDGDKGQLGTGRKGITCSPTCIEGELAGQSVKQVACGAFHTVALTAVGGVYAAGKDCSGPSKATFRPVQGALAGLRADEVACGDAHTAVIASQRRRLYTWGTGAGGRLGHGDFSNCDVPKLVEQLRDRDLKQVVCGPHSTAVVCACQQLSIEQKAALARDLDEAGWNDKSRRNKAAAALPNGPAAPTPAVGVTSRVTRGALLVQAAGSAVIGMAASPEWRARTLEAEVHGLRASLRKADEETQKLKEQLREQQNQFASLSRHLQAAGQAAASCADTAGGAAAADAPAPMPSVAVPYADGAADAGVSGDALQTSAAAAVECVQEIEPGVFVTVSAGKILRRVRFDRRTFTDEEAQDWWENNRFAVMRRLGLVMPSARPRKPDE